MLQRLRRRDLTAAVPPFSHFLTGFIRSDLGAVYAALMVE